MRKLVKEFCANHDNIGPTSVKNWCWPRDKVCKLLIDEPEVCSYFEEFVIGHSGDRNFKEDIYYKYNDFFQNNDKTEEEETLIS